MAICHDVIPEKVNGEVRLSASNPDDDALVCAAAYFGFQFYDKRDSSIVIKNKHLGRDEEVEVMRTLGSQHLPFIPSFPRYWK